MLKIRSVIVFGSVLLSIKTLKTDVSVNAVTV